MTEDEMRGLTIEVGAVMQRYAKAGKVAGFKMVVALWHSGEEVIPFICGASVSDGVQALLDDPEFAASADQTPARYPGHN